ncbi:MAG: glycogen synthase GlgA [Pseudomonadota bacterium]
MRVLMVTPECYPLIKTGGLADVTGALPLALAELGCDARVLLPAYRSIRPKLTGLRAVANLPNLFGGDAELLAGEASDGLWVFALDAPHLFDRPGNPYLGPDGADWPDNHFRFAALAWVGSSIGLGELGDWLPDVVHSHDWQAGLTSAYMAFGTTSPRPTVLTIHNLAFQGLCPANLLDDLHLPSASFTPDGLEFHGRIGFLKAGIRYADRLTTVSPTYAREIRTAEHGMGLDGILRQRADTLSGILNGIDESVWDPATDPAIDKPYSARRLQSKAINRQALQERFGLEPRNDVPLFCVVSRLTTQKGIDLIIDTLPFLLAKRGQLAVLGAGDAGLEQALSSAAAAHAGQIGVVIGYDEALSHRMQAGADAILVPSRFEPCGLTQLYGLRYGTLPIVARVGGLADTVVDANEAALRDGVTTGIQFAPVNADGLRSALERAFELFADQATWQTMQRRAMGRQVGWTDPANRYLALYRELATGSA